MSQQLPVPAPLFCTGSGAAAGAAGSAARESLTLLVQPAALAAERKCERVPHERVAFLSLLHKM